MEIRQGIIREVKLRNVSIGDLFKCAGTLYLKTMKCRENEGQPGKLEAMVVNIENGAVGYLDLDARVVAVDGYIQIGK